MTALDFPAAPTQGQVFDRWTWDGTKWMLTGGTGGGGGGGGSDGYSFVQDTPPTATASGQTWFDTSSGDSFVWFEDADGGQWVQDTGGGGGGGTGPERRGAWLAGVNTGQAIIANGVTTINFEAGLVGDIVYEGPAIGTLAAVIPTDGTYLVSYTLYANIGSVDRVRIYLADMGVLADSPTVGGVGAITIHQRFKAGDKLQFQTYNGGAAGAVTKATVDIRETGPALSGHLLSGGSGGGGGTVTGEPPAFAYGKIEFNGQNNLDPAEVAVHAVIREFQTTGGIEVATNGTDLKVTEAGWYRVHAEAQLRGADPNPGLYTVLTIDPVDAAGASKSAGTQAIVGGPSFWKQASIDHAFQLAAGEGVRFVLSSNQALNSEMGRSRFQIERVDAPIGSGGGGGVVDVPMIHAYGKNAPFDVTPNTNGTIWCDLDMDDPSGMYDPSDHAWVIPEDGYYCIASSVQVNGPANSNIALWIWEDRVNRYSSVAGVLTGSAAESYAPTITRFFRAGARVNIGYWTTTTGVQAQDTKFWITRVGVPYVGGTPGPAGPPGESPPADAAPLTASIYGPTPWALPASGRQIVPLDTVTAGNQLVEPANPNVTPGVMKMKVGGLFYITFGSWGNDPQPYVRVRKASNNQQIGAGVGSGVMMWTFAAGDEFFYEIEGTAGYVTNDIGMMITDMRRTA
jgi:hypothetical protein